MKVLGSMLAFAAIVTCTGCSELVGLRPFVSDQDAVTDARLPGIWVDGDDTYVVTVDGSGYKISITEKGSSTVYKLTAKMLKVGEARILDLTPADEDAFQVAVHTPLRVWVEGATIRMAFLDSAWLREKAAGQLTTEQVGDRLLITSAGDAVTRFLLTYGADDRAYGNGSVLTRQ
jgi:hypothetical protein